ncbi:CZB domain-containing protein [Persephonella sp. KM09-Lau-8]|uniref:CZB domain-containing protein n=1 Tax=Persephonella sp. KM09-Lau-8 TaxID=1158345 RepID=UPI000690F659|nr:CZB domain-containing protein [Persephonella sp. KM09-Lau-8]
MKKINELAEDIDIYISQHAIYINRLEKAIEGKLEFKPTDCHSCAFGKAIDLIKDECMENLPENLKTLFKEIYDLHCEFHNISKNILESKEKEKQLEKIKDISTKLFQKLLQFKNTAKKEPTTI